MLVLRLIRFVLLIFFLFRGNHINLSFGNDVTCHERQSRLLMGIVPHILRVPRVHLVVDRSQKPRLMLSHPKPGPEHLHRVKISILKTSGQIRVLDPVLFQQPIQVILMFHGILLFIQPIWQGILNVIGLDFHVLVELCYVQDWSLALGLDADDT